jgi:hypothetical protein
MRVYVWTNRDGILTCPWDDFAVNGRKRVFVGGGGLDTLNDDQIRALLCLTYRIDKIPDHIKEAIFYSGNNWAERNCPDGSRGKIMRRFPLKAPAMAS